jgi:MOSC domain-containing protein YiiM
MLSAQILREQELIGANATTLNAIMHRAAQSEKNRV